MGVCRASDPVRLFVLSVCFSGHFEAAPNYLERSRCLEPPQVVRPSSYPEPAQEQDVHSIRIPLAQALNSVRYGFSLYETSYTYVPRHCKARVAWWHPPILALG